MNLDAPALDVEVFACPNPDCGCEWTSSRAADICCDPRWLAQED